VADAGMLGRQTITTLQASGGSELGMQATDVTLPASVAAEPVLIAVDVEIASIMTVGRGVSYSNTHLRI
jgi:hypothetical protein